MLSLRLPRAARRDAARAVVGAGFASFESAGYALHTMLDDLNALIGLTWIVTTWRTYGHWTVRRRESAAAVVG